MATPKANAMVGRQGIKEEEVDMDTAANDDSDLVDEGTQLLGEASEDASANGVGGESVEDRTCPICKKVSKSALTLRMHLRNVHVNAGSSYVCELCGVSYKLKASLEKHVRGVHQENRERDAICDICGFATFTNQELKMHRQRVHDKTWKPYEKVYSCPYCDYSYHEKRVIDNHVKAIHEKRRDLQCPLCEFRAPHTIVLVMGRTARHYPSNDIFFENVEMYYSMLIFQNKHIRKHLVLSKSYKCMEQG